MTVRSIYLILLCVSLPGSYKCARILGVFPMISPSHYILGGALMRGLAEAGHDVTVITPYPENNPTKRGSLTEIFLDNYMTDFRERFDGPDSFKMKMNVFIMPALISFMGSSMTENLLNHTKVLNLIKSDLKFDVVIVSQFFNDAIKGFANHFNAHLVLFSNTGANSWLNHLVGNPSLPSFHPETLTSFPGRMSFFQRVQNTIAKFVYVISLHLLAYPRHNQLMQTYFPHPVDLNDVLYNASLVLLNSHTSFLDPHPLVPSMVEIGGFHIKPPKKLPDDLQKFLDEAKEGVIYFSMGSNLKSKNLPTETRDALLKAFSNRKEKVLWKWEDDVLPGQPLNVKLSKWFPQQEILAHPNVKVFITHGGLLSTIETVYHGVPIIAIPIFADQHANANIAKDAGYGLVLPFEEISEEKLTSVLNEIISNSQYRETANQRSKIMLDRQVSPLDNAVYWVEYIIRHNGAKHLRVPYLDLKWYQYYLLDVFGFIFVTFYVFVVILRKLFRYICCRKMKGTKLKKN